jgi:radical SAM protein with 4Fe4S-binding SPASM domain
VQFIPIIERVAEVDEDGTVPWTSWRDRPLYLQQGDRVTGRSATAKQYGRFLIDVFEEWVRRDIGEVYVQMFDVSLANWVGEPPGLCVHSETCGRALALEHTGDVYSCDHFVEPGYKLGNIRELPLVELVALQQQRQFGLDKRDTLPQYCLDCDVRFACHGGCPKDRFITTPPVTRDSTIYAPASRTSSTTSTGPCASWARCSPRTARPPRSSSCTPPRTQNAAATTPAPAAPAASGSTATAADKLARPSRGPEPLPGDAARPHSARRGIRTRYGDRCASETPERVLAIA